MSWAYISVPKYQVAMEIWLIRSAMEPEIMYFFQVSKLQ